MEDTAEPHKRLNHSHHNLPSVGKCLPGRFISERKILSPFGRCLLQDTKRKCWGKGQQHRHRELRGVTIAWSDINIIIHIYILHSHILIRRVQTWSRFSSLFTTGRGYLFRFEEIVCLLSFILVIKIPFGTWPFKHSSFFRILMSKPNKEPFARDKLSFSPESLHSVRFKRTSRS